MSDTLARYFTAHQPCKVLGLALTLDVDRGHATFPDHQPQQKPVVFVTGFDSDDPHGLGGLTVGDALWCLGGEPAHYRKLYVQSPADFITAAAAMYVPHIGLQCCYVQGSDANNKQGWTACRVLQLTSEQLASLRELAAQLQQYAQSHSLPLQTPTRHFRGGTYWKNALLRSRLIRDIPGDEDMKPIPVDLPPVHMQYLISLVHMLKTTAAPITVDLSSDTPTYQHVHDGDQPKVVELSEIMAHFQVAHIRSLRRELHRLATNHPKVSRLIISRATVEQTATNVFRVTPQR